MPSDTIRIAADLVRAGKVPIARQLLDEALQKDPNDASAWLCRASLAESAQEKQICLENTLHIDPDNQYAKHGLLELARNTNWIREQQQGGLGQGVQAPAPYDVRRGGSQEPPKQAGGPSNNAVAHPRFKRLARQLGISPTEATILAVMGVGFGMLILAIVGVLGANLLQVQEQRSIAATAVAEDMACRQEFDDQLTSLLSRFFRQQQIADTTSRINLPEQIGRLEDIRTEAWDVTEKSCSPTAHNYLMGYMDKTILTYLSFSANDSDSAVSEYYVDSLLALVRLDDEMISDGHPGGLAPMFRERGFFYWEELDDPSWKYSLNG